MLRNNSTCNRQIEAAQQRTCMVNGRLTQKLLSLLAILLLLIWSTAACRPQPEAITSRPTTRTITLLFENEERNLQTKASTVRELLAENDIALGELDEVDPPAFTPLSDGMTVTVVRVSESFEVIQQTIPFERNFVRSESMNEEDDPLIVQAGQDGLQETTWRIVYRDGLESERWPTNSVIVTEPVEEIVMVGIGSVGGNATFAGVLAFISDGVPVLMRGSSAFPDRLSISGQLDGRIFKLSPTGSHLLYSQLDSDQDRSRFGNSLWVLATAPNSMPEPLGVENVLWADWNPAEAEALEIAYSTARPTDAPPGWEANNDLWLGSVISETAIFTATQLIDAYPATYGWWGGSYAWSPQGDQIGYTFADEVGIININATAPRHIRLQSFTEYNTLSNWVWTPSLTWSPDGRYLAFTNHGSDDNRTMQFDSWVINANSGVGGRFVDQTGMWGHLHWTTVDENGVPNGQIAYLKSSDPIDSQRSNYTLWMMDADGSNRRQLFPPVGENSRFPRYAQFLAWGPEGTQLSFVFNEQLYLYDLQTESASRLTQDDAAVSNPTWAPYGAGLTVEDSAVTSRSAQPASSQDSE